MKQWLQTMVTVMAVLLSAACADAVGTCRTGSLYCVDTEGYVHAQGFALPNGETIDTYEVGTWTPSVGGTATYIMQSGSYVKFGSTVFVRGAMTINAIGTGNTGVIFGLPYSATAGTNHPLTDGISSGLAASPVSITPVVVGGSSSVTYYGRTAGAVTSSALALFGNLSHVEFSGSYFIE